MKRLEWRDERFVEVDGDDAGTAFRLPHDVSVESVADQIGDTPVVLISFPTFKDGRGFTQAQDLRRSGYRGDIRATGGLFLDQIGMAVRCGVTSLALDQLPTADAATAVVHRYPFAYQRASVGNPLWEVRS